MVDVVRIAKAVHEAEEVADRRHDVLARHCTVLIVARRCTEHPIDLAVGLLYLKCDEFAVAEERRLALLADRIHHRRRDRLALRENDLARLHVHNGLGEHLAQQTAAPAELLRQLVAADRREVVAARVKEQRLEKLTRIVLVRGLTRTQTAIDLDDRAAARLDLVRIALDRCEHARIVAEERTNLRVRLVAEGADEIGHGHLARTIDTHGDDVVCIRLQLDPRAAVRDHRRVEELLARRIDFHTVVRAGRADELADDNALCAVDDERPRIRHERKIAHEDLLLLDLARLAVHEAHVDAQGRGIRHVALLALVEIVLRLTERKRLKGKDEIPGEILNGRDVAENLRKPHLEKPPIALALDVKKMRHLHHFFDPRVAVAGSTADRHRIEHERCHPFAGISSGI